MNQDELQRLAQPIAEKLRAEHNPYCTVVITDDSVRMVETKMFSPVSEATTP